jgi:carbon storage regulator
MLVLTRKTGESILIDGHIKVTVVAVHRSKVLIGVEAPPDVRVDREEVRRRLTEAPPPELVSGAR